MFLNAAKLLLRVPDDGTNRSWTENLEGEGGKAMPFSFEFSADEGAENPGFEPQKNIYDILQYLLSKSVRKILLGN